MRRGASRRGGSVTCDKPHLGYTKDRSFIVRRELTGRAAAGKLAEGENLPTNLLHDCKWKGIARKFPRQDP
jgi:hypothetical protein